MTGHQAEPWHAGIAAKFFVARAVAEMVGGSSVWLTPDQDVTALWRARAPVISGGRLAERTLELAAGNGSGASAGTPGCAVAATGDVRVDWGGEEPALESVRAGVERHALRLRERASAGSGARQTTGAMEAALGERGRADAKLWASELGAMGAMDELLEAMERDPAGCVRAYNAAASANPEGGVAALRAGGGRAELPVWRVSGGTRRRVWSDELGAIDRAELAPRALLMTAVARLELCDLFIHGTGGTMYDRVMEAWIAGWLGEGVASRLAPAAGGTADVRLPLGALAASDERIDRAAWRAHSARHDPSLIGDDRAAEEKRRLVGAIRAARERGEDPGGIYRAMHALLERVREGRAGELAALDAEAARLAALRGSGALARDRTWAVFLHEDRVIDELAERVREAARAGLRSRAPARRG